MMKLNNYNRTKVDLSETHTKKELCMLKKHIKLIAVYIFVLSLVLIACNLVNMRTIEDKKDYFHHSLVVTLTILQLPKH